MNKNKLRIIETKIREYFNLDSSIVYTGCKKRELTDKRHLFCYCARQIENSPTFREISKYLSLKGTSSSVNAVRSWKNLLIYQDKKELTEKILTSVKNEIDKIEPPLF